jgi:UrcA family protein
MHRLSAALAVVIAGLSLAPAAMAGPEESVFVTGLRPLSSGGYATVRAKVELGDLDLSKTENAAASLARLEKAAQGVCAPQGIPQRRLAEKIKKCQTQAVTSAVAELKAPEVTRLAAK